MAISEVMDNKSKLNLLANRRLHRDRRAESFLMFHEVIRRSPSAARGVVKRGRRVTVAPLILTWRRSVKPSGYEMLILSNIFRSLHCNLKAAFVGLPDTQLHVAVSRCR